MTTHPDRAGTALAGLSTLLLSGCPTPIELPPPDAPRLISPAEGDEVPCDTTTTVVWRHGGLTTTVGMAQQSLTRFQLCLRSTTSSQPRRQNDPCSLNSPTPGDTLRYDVAPASGVTVPPPGGISAPGREEKEYTFTVPDAIPDFVSTLEWTVGACGQDCNYATVRRFACNRGEIFEGVPEIPGPDG